ncbi:hypothetical protein BB8028_0002g10050 [Beauveria bassiana]|uniref:Uncharacterized protein n=2 Tax=Beauveria bassiana TaxID=176275 RepID=A0A0A2V4V1_BEABA|nr:hypothetical protein BBAD15_g12281 [Beauveria bassiana D1-5]PQK10686.1 hypothetical protein BB8028_0002g10050 [Beauveria bassiana]
MPVNFQTPPIFHSTHAVHPKLLRSVYTSTFPNSDPCCPLQSVMEVTIEDSLAKLITTAVPESRVQSLQATASPGLHRIYRALTRDGAIIQCSLPQPPNRRMLRCEYGSIRSEATILQWLSGLCEEQPESGSSKLTMVDTEDKNEVRNRIRAQAILEYLPGLLDHGMAGTMHQLQYNVLVPRPGRVLSTIGSSLTAAARKSADFQIGQMLRRISLLHSPTFCFGNAEAVLPPVPQRSTPEQRRASVLGSRETFTSWSDAFGEMLHSAIQDAQASQITASYDSIRRCLHRFAHALDAVIEPRLVLMDAGLDQNVLVVMQEADSDNFDTSDNESGASEKSKESDGSDSSGSAATQLKVTGLREWIKPVFGDPLLNIRLSQTNSEHVVHGFSTPLADTLDDMKEVSESLSQNRQYVQMRLNLYRVYHALNAISVEYIRRDDDSDPRELRARKALVEAVRELEALDEAEASKRRCRLIEVVPSKRQRTLSP